MYKRKSYIKKVIISCINILNYEGIVSNYLITNNTLMHELIKLRVNLIDYANEKLRADLEIVLFAVKKYGLIL